MPSAAVSQWVVQQLQNSNLPVRGREEVRQQWHTCALLHVLVAGKPSLVEAGKLMADVAILGRFLSCMAPIARPARTHYCIKMGLLLLTSLMFSCCFVPLSTVPTVRLASRPKAMPREERTHHAFWVPTC